MRMMQLDQQSLAEVSDLFFASHDIGIMFGGERNCKTLHGVRLARIAHNAGYPVYSNVELFEPGGGPETDWRCDNGRIDSTNPIEAINQLFELFDQIEDEGTQGECKFLLLDEFSDLVDAQDWKKAVYTSNIWKQLGKMGFTTFVTNQQLSMTYNRYRDNATRVVYTRMLPDKLHYRLIVLKQSVLNHKEYHQVYDVLMNAEEVFPYYDTFQRMYSGNRKKKKSNSEK